jgi:hypothetical protein
MGVGGQLHVPALLTARFPEGKSAGTLCTEGWVGPMMVWTGAEYLASTGIRSPYSPSRCESLYRLRHPGPP